MVILIDKVSRHQLRDIKFDLHFNQKLIDIMNAIDCNSLKNLLKEKTFLNIYKKNKNKKREYVLIYKRTIF